MKTPNAELLIRVDSVAAALDSGSPLAESGLHPAVADRLIELAKRNNSKTYTVVIDNRGGDAAGVSELPQAIHQHFEREVDFCSQRIRENYRYARRATLAGLGVVAVLLGIANELPEEGGKLIVALHESLFIFAWVTMWRPAELWLFDHLPDRRLRSLAKKLQNAEVTLRGG